MEKTSLSSQQKTVREELRMRSEQKYAEFSGALIPGHATMLGVRIPAIRKLAKEFADYRAPRDAYFEEIMLEGIAIGGMKDYGAWEARVKEFLPRIRDWSVNDCMLATCKLLARNRENAWGFLSALAGSEEEFYARFGVIAIMGYYLEADWIERALAAVETCRHAGYYARMGVAWFYATALAKFPAETLCAVSRANLPEATRKMLRAKAAQSYRVDGETLDKLKAALGSVPD